MSVQTPRYFSLLNQWRLAVLLMVGLFVIAACFHDDDRDGKGNGGVVLPSTITRVSLSSTGAEANSRSSGPGISRTGRYVVFSSDADNLVESNSGTVSDIFMRDVAKNTTSRISISIGGTPSDKGGANAVTLDGQSVLFESLSTTLVSDDFNNKADIFLHNTQTGVTERISLDNNGEEVNGNSRLPAMSEDGQFIAFQSQATNLVSGDTNEVTDIFLWDTVKGITTRLSVNSEGVEANDTSQRSSISRNGQYVAFYSIASNLVTNDENGFNDVYLHNIQTNETELISINAAGTLAGNRGSVNPSVSADGRFVVFHGIATDLVSDDGNDTRSDVFLRDRLNKTTTLISVSSEGVQGDTHSANADISADGRYIVFESFASNLVLDDNNEIVDIFVHDIQSGKTARVSVSAANEEGNGPSQLPAISADGQYITFRSDASNLVENDTNGVRDIFIAPNPLAD